MCAIFGTTSGGQDYNVLKALDTMKYRGPDHTGTWSNHSVSLGSNRLAIIDNENTLSNQPFYDEPQKVIIVFNGEIFNYKELKEVLKDEFNFKTNGDTEVVLNAYKKWGVDCFKYLYGMFAICIYDVDKNMIILGRDFAGIKPLYYHINKDNTLFFSSEISGIKKIIDKVSLTLDTNAIEDLFSLGYIISPKTQYKEIKKLEKKSILEFNIQKKDYIIHQYDIPEIDSTEPSLEKELKHSLDLHLTSDVPVGVLFSGGVDSSLIAALLKEAGFNLQSYHISMSNKLADTEYAKKISNHLNIDYKKFDFDTKEFDQIYEEFFSKISEPQSNAALLPTYYLATKINKEVSVVLTGTGIDEFFLGYERNKNVFRLRKYKDYTIDLFDRLYFWTPNIKMKRYLFSKLFFIFKKPISLYLLNASLIPNIKSWFRFKELCQSKKITPINLESEFYLENDLLKYSDFALSLASVEGRFPFVSTNMLQMSKILENFLVFENHSKSPIKKLAEKYFPKELIYRKKSGFGLPLLKFYNESKLFKTDLAVSLSYLQNQKEIQDIIKKLEVNQERVESNNPYLLFTIVTLYHSLQ